MLTAYNYNRNPRNLSTLTVPEYPVINGEHPERYRTTKQLTALEGMGDRKIDAQEAMLAGFDMQKHITFKMPTGMNPFGGFKYTGAVNKLDRFVFDFGHLSDKNKPENQQRREPFNMESGVTPSFEIDLAPTQRNTPVHRLRRRQDTQTLVTPLYSEVASASTAHLSKLVSNKRMLDNRDGVTINTSKSDPLAGNKNFRSESKNASVKKVAFTDITKQQVDSGYESIYRHNEPINTKYYDRFNPRDRKNMLVESGLDDSLGRGMQESSRNVADIRKHKELDRHHDAQNIQSGINSEFKAKSVININPELLHPRRDFIDMQVRKETGYNSQLYDKVGNIISDQKINYIPESNIRRQAGFETNFRLDTTNKTRETETDKHVKRDVLNIDSKLLNDYSDKYQIRSDGSNISTPNASRVFDYYTMNAGYEPTHKVDLYPDIPDYGDRMNKTMPNQEMHSGASRPGTSRDMFSGSFNLTMKKGRENIRV